MIFTQLSKARIDLEVEMIPLGNGVSSVFKGTRGKISKIQDRYIWIKHSYCPVSKVMEPKIMFDIDPTAWGFVITTRDWDE